MDRQSWIILRQLIHRAVREIGPSRRVVFSDSLVLRMYFWAVAHDRPMGWACDRQNYHSHFRPCALPSVSQFCRRIKTGRFQQHLQYLHDALADQRALSGINFFDGKPLVVGNYSRDPDAKTGYGVGRIDKGYKLHALVTEDRRIAMWSVLPLNIHEMGVARILIDQAEIPKGTVFMADGNYDAHKLHKDIYRRGGWLWTRPRGMAKHPVTLRQMGAARRALISIWEQAPDYAEWIYKRRIHVEATFSNLTSYGGGLGPLPAFVRRLDRVRRWVGAKIILYHLRLKQRKEKAA